MNFSSCEKCPIIDPIRWAILLRNSIYNEHDILDNPSPPRKKKKKKVDY
jgi:hypothetical protein